MNNNVTKILNNQIRQLCPMPVPWLVNDHLEKFRKKMDKHRQDILKWKNEVGQMIEQKLAGTYKKMGCIAALECYGLILDEYSVELTNNRKLIVKLGQATCTYK